jgi:PAS domain S-box-containing protein
VDSSVQYTLFVIIAPLAAIVLVGVTLYARNYRPSPQTQTISWLALSVSGWLIFNTLELIASSESMTVLWGKTTYFFIVLTPLLWLIFAMHYTERQEWLAPFSIAMLSVIPAITILLVWTNELHHLLWESYNFTQVGDWLYFGIRRGPWFWINAIYLYILVLIGAALILRRYIHSFRLYRRQSFLMVIGALTPILFNMIYNFSLIPGLQKDYTSLSFAFASVAFMVSMLNYRLFDLRPVAREAVIDSMIDAMLAIDLNGYIIDFNPIAEQLYNLPTENAIGQPAKKMLSAWPEIVEQLVEPKLRQLTIESNIKGVTRYYDLRISPLYDRRNQLSGQLVVLRDITHRIEIETALRRYTKELEKRNEELDAFAHTVAHDLKSPLNALIGYGYLLQHRADQLSEEDTKEFLDSIVISGRKMTNIIDELLLLANVRKVGDVTMTPLDMAMLSAGALDRLSTQLAQKKAEVVLPESWHQALGHAPWIEQVWFNYITNALKYGGEPPLIELGNDEPQPGSNGRSLVRFWVRDNGPGIPDEDLEHLFTPFTRLERTRAEGHGLGLSIVRSIIEKQGGEVGVESTQGGGGSLFWFSLPAVLSEDENEKLRLALEESD